MIELGKDINPLGVYPSYTVKHILVAFEYSQDAYTSRISQSVGKSGTMIDASELGGECGGKAIVVVNEFADTTATLTAANTNWSFFSSLTPTTTSYTGTLEISDRSGFLFTETLSRLIFNDGQADTFFNPESNTSLYHLTFAWVPVFLCTNNESGASETVNVNPLYFHVSKFTQSVTALVGRVYILDFLSCYNTHGLQPQFSNLTQTTITHAESNTINSNPASTTPTSGILPTRIEDSRKKSSRIARLNKTRYMKTIREFCEGLELALNKQIVDNKSQVQTFLSMINDSYRSGNIRSTGNYVVPFKYKIIVDDYYKNLKLDNRNLPFEQYEQDQLEPGVSSVTFPANANISAIINTMMKMSKKVGLDHKQLPTPTFKVTTVTNRTCEDVYEIHIKINNYINPYNGNETEDTAPGNSAIDEPIYLSYQDGNSDFVTVMGIEYSSMPSRNMLSSEKIQDSTGDVAAVYGNREQMTVRRYNDFTPDFFRNSFSGLKSMRGLYTDNGVENPEATSALSNFNPKQQTTYAIQIVGNPYILNDLNRHPLDVISGSDSYGEYKIYKNCEFEPIYLRLKIYLRGDTRDSDQSGAFYYDGYLHVTDVVSNFIGGLFTQTIYCSRTEEKI